MYVIIIYAEHNNPDDDGDDFMDPARLCCVVVASAATAASLSLSQLSTVSLVVWFVVLSLVHLIKSTWSRWRSGIVFWQHVSLPPSICRPRFPGPPPPADARSRSSSIQECGDKWSLMFSSCGCATTCWYCSLGGRVCAAARVYNTFNTDQPSPAQPLSS